MSMSMYDLIMISRDRHAPVKPHVIHSYQLGLTSAAGIKDVWNALTERVYLTTGETLNLVSDDVADAAAGTGARTITINGLDNAFAEIEEDVTMNGTSNVLTSKTYRRVDKIIIKTTGTGNTNAGVITATYSSAATVEATIADLEGISKNSHYTVPAGKSLLILKTEINVAKSATGTATGLVDVYRYLRPDGAGFYEDDDMRLDVLIQNFASFDSLPGVLIPEKTDTLLKCTTTTDAVHIRCKQTGILFTPN